MYEFNLTLEKPFETAMELVREALAEEKLGIISEIDVQAVFKAKMDKDIPPYRILGACSPPLADRAIAAEPSAGVLLPCNLVLRTVNDNQTAVSFMDPEAILGLSESTEVNSVGADAKEKLQRVFQALS